MGYPFSMSDGTTMLQAWAKASGYRQAICSRVDMRVVTDPYSDLSHLNPEVQEDAARLAQYDVTWEMVGVLAVAHVAIVHGPEAFQLLGIPSPGLWGVESDSEVDYLRTVAFEECAVLRDMLQQLHCYIPAKLPVVWDPVFAMAS